MRRASEYPLLCSPVDAIATTASPELHAMGAEHLVAVDDADAEPGEVVLVGRHHAGVLGGLAADQRAAGLHAAVGDAGDHLLDVGRVELADRDVVQEEQRLGARHDDVVDDHRDEVDADRVVAAQLPGELELGPDAVSRTDQDRVLAGPWSAARTGRRTHRCPRAPPAVRCARRARLIRSTVSSAASRSTPAAA